MMQRLEAENIYLRALEPEDLEFVYQIENDLKLWEVSNTQTPYSRFLIRQYLENAHQDIYEAKQLRLVICDKKTDEVYGLIDIFDYDPKNARAGIGIVIQRDTNRMKGIGSQALK
jgi:diamine N-acetyltransferase